MSKDVGFSELWQSIQCSAGSAYVNQTHGRSFSKNVFRMNAIELMDSSLRVRDPEHGLLLMRQDNREAGLQAHREISRQIHNFVASAMTLVEHTRNFMRRHYSGEPVLDIYEDKARAVFASSPVAQFVQGLRNYMVHRGLPSSSMYVEMKSQPNSPDGFMTVETGVKLETAALLEGSGWSASAKEFLRSSGDHIHVHDFANEYVALVDDFQSWLDALLEEHHKDDLKELAELSEKLQQFERPSEQGLPTHDAIADSFCDRPYEFTQTELAVLKRQSEEIFASIRRIHFKEDSEGFPSERRARVLNQSDIVGTPRIYAEDIDGENAFSFISRGDCSYGLVGSPLSNIDALVDSVMRSTWARALLSRSFIENVFLEWADHRYDGETSAFSDLLCASARERVVELEIWAPIAGMEIEEGFDFGRVRIEPIAATTIDSFRERLSMIQPAQADPVDALFARLRDEIEGSAAVVIRMKGEPLLTNEHSLEIAKDSIGLLRFFSPGAGDSSRFIPIAPAGAEHVPTSKVISLGEGSFSLVEAIQAAPTLPWRLSKNGLSKLKSGLLDHAAALIDRPPAGTLAYAIRESILAYSNGTTLVDPLDRLRSTIFAVEGVFLKHTMESRAEVLSSRLGKLLAEHSSAGDAVALTVRKIYWLQHHPQGIGHDRRADSLLKQFTSLAYHALQVALENVGNFGSKNEFLEAIERTDG